MRTADRDRVRVPGARRAVRVLAVTAGLAAIAAASSGCVVLNGSSVSQRDLLGPGVLSLTACVSQQNSQTCPSGGRSGSYPTPSPGVQVQALIGVQMPTAFVLSERASRPSFFTDWFGDTYTQSPTYAAELTLLEPPKPGFRWTGYISQPTANFTPGYTYRGEVDFARPPAADGTPAPPVTEWRVVSGARLVNDTALASRPVTCSTDDGTVCIDSNVGFTSAKGLLRDLGILRPTTVTAARGTTAVVPVTLKFSGEADPAYNFALTATTSLPGTSATPNVPTFAPPTNSTASVSVSVPVPADAAPGTYDVTLTATLGTTGETRSATGRLVVPAPPAAAGPSGGTPAGAAPVVRLTAVRGLTARTARSKGLPVRVSSDSATQATITLTQVRRVRSGGRFVSRAVGVGRRTLAVPAGTTTVRVRSNRLLPGRVTIRITGTGFSARTTTQLR